MPVYKSWICYRETVKQPYIFCPVVKYALKSFYIDGTINKVTVTVEHEGCSEVVIVRVNEINVIEDIRRFSCVPKYHHADITSFFEPRVRRGEEVATKVEVGFYKSLIGEWIVTAWLTLDVTGTIIETTSKTGESSELGGYEAFIEMAFQLFFMMIVMSLLMGMMSSFMGVFR